MRSIHLCGRLLMAVALSVFAAGVQAQGYPNRPVRLVVADAAGGAPDQLARLVAQKVSETLGQQVIVDNRPGAGGALGADLVAKSLPDGYTLLLTTTAIYAILPEPAQGPAIRSGARLRAGRAHRDRFERARDQRRRCRRKTLRISSGTRRPIPARSTTPRQASARRRTSRARC